MQNIPISWLICAVLAIMLFTMDYVRRTGPLNDLFRRSEDGGGIFGTLIIIGLILAAILLLPQLDLLSENRFASPAPVQGANAGAESVRDLPEAEPEKEDKKITTDRGDLVDFEYPQGRDDREQPRRQADVPNYRQTTPAPLPPAANYPVGTRVKGRPTEEDIVYVIPTWAGEDPAKALRQLQALTNRSYVFAIAGKPLVQVGYGPFRSWEEGEQFRMRNGLKRSPRAFRISER